MKLNVTYEEHTKTYWVTSDKGHVVQLSFEELDELKQAVEQQISEHMQRELDLGAFGCEGGGCII